MSLSKDNFSSLIHIQRKRSAVTSPCHMIIDFDCGPTLTAYSLPLISMDRNLATVSTPTGLFCIDSDFRVCFPIWGSQITQNGQSLILVGLNLCKVSSKATNSLMRHIGVEVSHEPIVNHPPTTMSTIVVIILTVGVILPPVTLSSIMSSFQPPMQPSSGHSNHSPPPFVTNCRHLSSLSHPQP